MNITMEIAGVDAQGFFFVFLEWVRNFYNSGFFLAIKIFLGIYTFVLFVDIVLLLMLRGVSGNIRAGIMGTDMPATPPSKMRKRWDKVVERLKGGDESQYKVAIIEADSIADSILSGIGYPGANMTERLLQIKPSQLDDIEKLRYAHSIRNKVVHEEGFTVSRELAEEVVGIYEDFLKYLFFLE